MRTFLLVSFFVAQTCYGQGTSAKNRETIKAAKEILGSYLELNTGKNFYPLYDSTGKLLDFTSTGMHHYVYASFKHEMKSVFGDNAFRYFGYNDSLANYFADSLTNLGYDVMVYKTAGTSGAEFNKRMLEYDAGTIAFIMLHEGFHRHRQNSKAKLPYVFEEAVCDLTGNAFAQLCVSSEADLTLIKKFSKVNEKIYRVINQAIDGTLAPDKCTKLIKKILDKEGDLFQHDRYEYNINNAYLLRYTSYCKYYFAVKEALLRSRDYKGFYAFITGVEGTETEVLQKIENAFR
ncbi:MAG TPA: hypothetical protein VK177_15310 [Flavobacteriales bacterium]|nr:hypothetical protein [Flavobacteriales bacterium]